MDDFVTGSRWTVAPVGGWLTLVVGLALLGLLGLGWAFSAANRRLTRRRRMTLASLRLATILMAVLAMLRPTVIYSTIRKQPAKLIVLADVSRSMQVADEVGKATRWSALKEALADSWATIAEIEEDLEVQFYAFDSRPRPIAKLADGKWDFDFEPEGTQTDLGATLDFVLKSAQGERLAGVVLLSDGAQRMSVPYPRSPQEMARQMADAGQRLYVVPFGQSRSSGQSRNISFEELSTSQAVPVRNQLRVGGTVRVDGFDNQRFTAQLFVESPAGEMEPVASTPLVAKEAGQRLPFELIYVPETPGEIKVSLRVAPQTGEMVTVDNEISTFVTVLKKGLNVLYLEGPARPEQKFIRKALQGPPIQVDFFAISPRDRDKTRPGDLADRLKPGKYDVYILGNLDATMFEPGELESLRQSIEARAGFLMLGGEHSFGAGGYSDTPLADVLPIEVNSLDRQDPQAVSVRADVHWTDPLPLLLTPFGKTQGFLRLAPGDEGFAKWEQLPPLRMANKLGKLKPGANVLVETPDHKRILIGKDYNRGRVLAFAGDTTWRWPLKNFGVEHQRFWRQTVLWLARMDESTEGSVTITLPQRRHAPGSKVDFTLAASTPQGDPIPDATFEAELVAPGGRKIPVQRLRTKAGETTGSVTETDAPGDYTLIVKGKLGTEQIGEARARFIVFDQDLELDNPAADHGLLASLALTTEARSGTGPEDLAPDDTGSTNGRRKATGVLAPEQLPELMARLKKEASRFEITTETSQSLWDNWVFLLIFVSLLCVEWYLRKRFGLV